MIGLWRGFLILSACAMASCAQLGMQGAKEIDLAEPELLGQAVQVSQQIDIRWQDKNHQLMVVWSQQGGLFQVVGLSAAGQMLFRAHLTGASFKQQTFVAELEQLDLKQLLRHIQIAYWPEAAVVELLSASKEQLVLEPGQRIVRRGGKLVARYEFENHETFSSVRISARAQPSLSVTTLTVQALNTAEAETRRAIKFDEGERSPLMQEHAG